MAPLYQLNINTRTLRVLAARSRVPFTDPAVSSALAGGVRAWGALVQARAVRNVSGYPVVFDGSVFRVKVVTGTLKGSIELQYPYGSAFRARVFVNGTRTSTSTQVGGRARTTSVADYASSIEQGHKAIDLKQFMQGKVVPFFGARGQKARGPYAGTGLKPVVKGAEDYGSQWQSQTLNAKLQAKGKGPMVFEKKGGHAAYEGGKKGGSTYFIAFRRVGKTGWVIPRAEPRPFMRAALMGTREQGRKMLVARLAPLFDPRNL